LRPPCPEHPPSSSFLLREFFILGGPPADNDTGACRGHSEGGGKRWSAFGREVIVVGPNSVWPGTSAAGPYKYVARAACPDESGSRPCPVMAGTAMPRR